MDKAIPLDVVHALRQLGINPSKALEFLALDKENKPQPETEIHSATPLIKNME
ncbi:hypothetical protein LJK88_39300 [Paenibacillus sp. P26]|nr:hypothetical protein LJK88_39300 [Paenibacillus sp. P26]